jgi:hypothetical protein
VANGRLMWALPRSTSDDSTCSRARSTCSSSGACTLGRITEGTCGNASRARWLASPVHGSDQGPSRYLRVRCSGLSHCRSGSAGYFDQAHFGHEFREFSVSVDGFIADEKWSSGWSSCSAASA